MTDLATVFSGGSVALAKAPGLVGKIGEVAGTVGRTIDPITAAGKVAKGAGGLASEVLGITTGAGGEAIRTAARSGAEGGEAGKAFLENLTGKAPAGEVVNDARGAVRQLRVERGNAYRETMAKIGESETVLDFDKVDTAVSEVAKVKTYKGQNLSEKTQDIRNELMKAVDGWKELDPAQFHTAEGLDALKQKIGDIRDATQYGTPARVVADSVYRAVRQTIVDEAPAYAKVMKGYEEASDIIKEVEKTLSVKPDASVDTALRKLQSVLRDNVNTNYGRRAELVEFLKNAGAPHLMEKLAGQTLGAFAPRGLGRIVAGGEGATAMGTLAAGNPAVAAAMVGGMAASSPALVGAGAYGAGAATRLPLRTLGRSAFQAGRLPQQ